MQDTKEQPGRTSARFLINVLWNWAGIGISLVSAFVLSRYMVRTLGDERYGIWSLAFSLVEYYWLVDMGFRSATAKYSAHFLATGELHKINEIISTGLFYFSLVASALMLGTIAVAPFIHRFFVISPKYQGDFTNLVLLIGLSWACGAVFVVFQACLEGFQRFDIVSRIFIVSTGIRVAGSFLLLYLGYGLVALGAIVVASQVGGYVLNYFSFRKVFPTLRISRKLVTMPVLRQMAGYGFHTATATVATQFVNQTAPLVIGHYQPAAFVGYFNIPVRLMQSTGVEVAARVGVVSSSRSAELCAKGDSEGIARVGIFTNRYCLMLFAPIGIFLALFARELITVWLSPGFAAMSAPLVPMFILSTAIAVSAQFNSSSILYGLGAHSRYARGLLVEGIASVIAMFLVVPRYGILGAAWVMAICMILNRGLYAPWVLCRAIHVSYLHFMQSIFVRPVATAIPAFALGLLLKRTVLPGGSWLQLIAAGTLITVVYLGIAVFTCLEGHHRELFFSAVRAKLSGARIQSATT